MIDIGSLGARLRARRRELGWTQEELAERAGLSADIVGRVERGARQSCRWSTIVAMSTAMDIDPGDMVGKGNHISQAGRPGDASVLAVRNAVYDPSLLPGLASEATGEAAAPAELWEDVQRSYGAYFAGEFGVLAAELPGILARVRATQAARGRGEAAPSLAHTYQLAACLLVHVGKTDAALAAAERAITAAQDDADSWRAATMYGTYAWTLLHAARYDEGIRLATRVADTITPTMSPKADPRQLTAWGGLMMHAAVLAGAAGRRDDADEYLAAARAGGALMQSDRHDYWVSFGPSQVAVQTAHIHTATESPEVALRAHAQVQPVDLLPIQRARHLLNVASALRMRRRLDQALRVTEQAESIGGAEWFRHQRFAAALVADLRSDLAREPEGLRRLSDAFSHGVGGAV